MKILGNILIYVSVFSFMAMSCKPADKARKTKLVVEQITINDNSNLTIYGEKGDGFNYPSFAIWTEDMDGNYISTLFITRSYATGIYKYEMKGDTIWIDEKGPSYQPASLPYWTHKKGLINNNVLIPDKDNPYVDAYTGATPKGSFKIEVDNKVTYPYRILMEVNQLGDYNEFWSNNKFPESSAYKRSGQPSLIYGVTVNESDSLFYLNPIGHGDPEGKTGKLFTNLSTITSPLSIFTQVKIKTNSK